MVQEAYTYVEKTPNLDVKLKLIDTLRTITAGKVCFKELTINHQQLLFIIFHLLRFSPDLRRNRTRKTDVDSGENSRDSRQHQ